MSKAAKATTKTVHEPVIPPTRPAVSSAPQKYAELSFRFADIGECLLLSVPEKSWTVVRLRFVESASFLGWGAFQVVEACWLPDRRSPGRRTRNCSSERAVRWKCPSRPGEMCC